MRKKRASRKKDGVPQTASPSTTEPEREPAPVSRNAPVKKGWILTDARACFLLAVVCLFSHGFLLTNNGPIWDGWYWLEWLKHKNWAPVLEYTGAQGLPIHRVVFGMFAFFPDIIVSGMFLNVLCLYLESLLAYFITLKISRLRKGEAFAIAALSLSLPFFNAAQDFPVFGLILFRLLFLLASFLAFRGLELDSPKKQIFRVVSLVIFAVCCITNGALFVFYGGFYLLLFTHHLSLNRIAFRDGIGSFLGRYPDYLVLPPVTFWARNQWIVQFGWYENYNKATSDISNFWPNLGSFFSNLLGYHVKYLGGWLADNPVLLVVTLGACACVFIFCKQRIRMECGETRNGMIAGFGVLLLVLALVPLALVGKTFLEVPVSLHSRHCLLLSLPLAILIFVFLRCVFFYGGRLGSAFFAPVLICAVGVSGIQLNFLYLKERMEWIFRHSALHNLKTNALTRESTVLFLQNYSSTGLLAYDLYGAAGAFGSLSRYVTSLPPANRRFYTPSDMYFGLLMTSIIPNEFRQVNPAGRQLVVTVKQTPPAGSSLDTALRYLRLRWFASSGEFETFLGSLTQLELGLLKEASALIPGLPRDKPQAPPGGIPEGGFDNGIGMTMVRMPEGWWAGKFEVTQAEYAALMETNPSLFKDPVRPVECVSWWDAMEFCRRLTQVERDAGRLPAGFVYRLPSTREWEFLAAGTPGSEAVFTQNEPLWHTEPVGSKGPNSLGLHDVLGNVWEWCFDWSDASRRYKVSRGGAWVNHPSHLSPYPGEKPAPASIAAVAVERLFGPRRMDYPDQGFWERGFRCVLAPQIAEEPEHRPGGG